MAGIGPAGELHPAAAAGKGHHVGPSRHRRDRHAAAHDLRVRRKIRRHPEQPRGASRAEPEARDHLVVDKEGAVLRGELPRGVEELQRGRQAPARPEERLEDEAGHPAAVPVEELLQHRRIVEARDDDLRLHPAREPPALRVLEAAGILLVVVHPDQAPGLRPVPAAAHLHHQLAPGEGPGEKRGVHGGQGAAGGEAHAVEPRARAHQLRRAHLQGIRESRLQAEPVLEPARQRVGDDPAGCARGCWRSVPARNPGSRGRPRR